MIRYFVTALAAALYWLLAAWLCFLSTGHDPIDALTGTAPLGQRIAVAAIMVLFVVGFAVIARYWRDRQTRKGVANA